MIYTKGSPYGNYERENGHSGSYVVASGPEHKNITKYDNIQGLLKLLWTVYSEGKLQSCLKLRNFQNPFNKDKSVGL